MSKMRENFDAMTREEKLKFLTSTNRVTIRTISQVEDHTIVKRYIPRIRGINIYEKDGKLFYDTPEEAKTIGKKVLAKWKNELETIKQ